MHLWIRYFFLNSQGIYMFLTCQSKHMNFWKIVWSTWFAWLNVANEYWYFEIHKGIYMLSTCQSKHMNFENILIDLICANKCGYWVCIFWNSQGIKYVLDMSI